jgi:hypothetical protein
MQSQRETAAQVAPAVAAAPADAAVEQALARARALEAAGKTQEAIGAYEAILAGDPDHALARERVAALQAIAAPPPDPIPEPAQPEPTPTPPDPTPVADPTPDAAKTSDPAPDVAVEPTPGEVKPDPTPAKPPEPVHVQFTVEAYPKSEIFVDGVTRGKTPQKLDLLSGSHKFEIKAPGFLPHEETIEVAADGQKSLKVKLTRRPAGTGGINRAEEDAASNELDPENDAPTTKIEVPLKR